MYSNCVSLPILRLWRLQIKPSDYSELKHNLITNELVRILLYVCEETQLTFFLSKKTQFQKKCVFLHRQTVEPLTGQEGTSTSGARRV